MPEMKISFFFPPPASPTYLPLGIATLCSFIRKNRQPVSLRVIDANNLFCQHFFAESGIHDECWSSIRDKSPSFFEIAAYEKLSESFRRIQMKQETIIEAARSFLVGRTLEPWAEEIFRLMIAGVAAEKPHVLAFSVMYQPQLIMAAALCRYIRQTILPKENQFGQTGHPPLIVLGGAAVTSINVDELIEAVPEFDAVCIGEGEPLFDKLIALFNGAGIFSSVVGIQRHLDYCEGIVSEPPLPDFSFFDLGRYPNPLPVLPILLSRGCRWRKCRFCAHNLSFGPYRKIEIERVVHFMKSMSETSEVRHWYFADQYIDSDDLAELSETVKKEQLTVFFHIMGRPLARYRPEVLALAASAGLRWISWGIESGSERLLRICNKGVNVKAIPDLFRSASRFGISNLAMMIFGLPTATEADFEDTFALCELLQPWTDQFTASNFQLFDKTEFARQSDRFGLEITGREVLFRSRGGDVHSLRLNFRHRFELGITQSSRGLDEVRRFKDRMKWLGEPQLFDRLSAEHYLIYASHRAVEHVREPVKARL